MFAYKLMLFGFSDLCEDYDEVLIKLKNIPAVRANSYETMEQCYLIDIKTGEKFDIICENGKGYVVKDFKQS